MKTTGQGILKINKLIHSCVLVLCSFILSFTVLAETFVIENSIHNENTLKHHVFIIYSPENSLHSKIIQQISGNLTLKYPDTIISHITPGEKITRINNSTDIIIGIGYAGMKDASQNYPETKKLFISTSLNKYRLDIKKNKNDAILYMTQPFCRQMKLINLLNKNWKTIGILSSQINPIDITAMQQCADKYDTKIVIVTKSSDDNLTHKIKQVLKQSDVLLALPDSRIYNRRTVKNILLTSYRYRKPVIAFSKNFVNAGALAAIHSSTEQIVKSASYLLEQFFKSGGQFKMSVNYPQEFYVSINRQVFRALDLNIPDTDKIKQAIEYSEKNELVVSQ